MMRRNGAEERGRELLEWFVGYQQESPRTKFQMAVMLRSEERLIGNCGIRQRSIGASEADIGCGFDPDYWGNGYAAEAIAAILKFGFEELGLHRIWSSSIADNSPAARLVEGLGLRLEGRFRERVLINGDWYDELIHAILDHEWRARN